MAKVAIWSNNPGSEYGRILSIWCPGCGGKHNFGEKIHSFNGDFERPTLSPSLLCDGYIAHPDFEYGKKIHCHSFIVNGKIQFLADCDHPLAGQTVDLPECPSNE